jgi:chromosome segregation ATPase
LHTGVHSLRLNARARAGEDALARARAREADAVREKYALEARLAQALTDCQGLSGAAANLRAQARKDAERVRRLEEQGAALQARLKDSVPATKVQSVLEAAAQRVSGICDGAQKSQRDLDAARREVRRLRQELEGVPAEVERRCAEEVRQRKRAEARARDATQRADKLERRLRELEGSTAQLQQMLKSAQEGIGVMKTIARIRNTGGATDGKGGGSVGFDAVAQTIDGVSRNVNNKVKRAKLAKQRRGLGGRRQRKEQFANMVNY